LKLEAALTEPPAQMIEKRRGKISATIHPRTSTSR
jgi:hypothetical protein